MGNASQMKAMRKQIRNVAQESFQNALTAEAVAELDKGFTAHANTRLETISKNVDKELRRIDGDTREFRRLLMQDASLQISRELLNLNIGLLAWQNVLRKEIGISEENTKDFEAKIEEEKLVITAKLEAEAKAMQEAKKAEEEAAAAAAKLKAETEGTPVSEQPTPAAQEAAPETQTESA
jgi:hypothetical protein